MRSPCYLCACVHMSMYHPPTFLNQMTDFHICYECYAIGSHPNSNLLISYNMADLKTRRDGSNTSAM